MKAAFLVAALLMLALPGFLSASILTFSPTPSQLGELDHGTVWTWRIDSVSLAGYHVASASLTISGIYNWQDEPNQLFLHLLDTASNPGTAHRSDPSGLISDYFLNPASNFAPAYGASNVLLTAPTFAGGYQNRINYTYIFTPQQLAALESYINSNGNFALAFDPDCHYYNDGVSFQMTTAHAPEPGTSLLVGVCLLLGIPVIRRFARVKSRSSSDAPQA
jgi:hypothetical protein